MFLLLNYISRVQTPDIVRNMLVNHQASIKLFKGNGGNGKCMQQDLRLKE